MSFFRLTPLLWASFCVAILMAGSSKVVAQDNSGVSAPPLAEAVASPSGPHLAAPTGKTITLSDFGAEDLGYLAIPNTPPTVGVVLVPDAYGLDDATKREADRLASEGYLAVAVDIYNGSHLTDPGQVANMVENLDGPTVLKTVESGVRLFHESPKFRVNHVVMVGWGIGANYVWQATGEPNAPDGAILFYGPVETGVVHKCPIPVCAFYSDRDPRVPREEVLNFQHALRNAGSDFTAWFIAAGSGWSNPLNKVYNPVEDREAWKVADPFIVRIAAMPVVKKGPSAMDKAKDSVKNFLKKL